MVVVHQSGGNQGGVKKCPLWVKSGHWRMLASYPLYPQKRTLVQCSRMSALCQKRTFAGSPVNYSDPPEKVLQSEILPELKPFKNQRLRCAEVPWVKASGTT